MSNIIKGIDSIIRRDPGMRGLASKVKNEDLSNILDEIKKSKKVIILTGFCIKDVCKGETDGPIGAVNLAVTLEAMEKEVIIVTDIYSIDLVRKGLDVKQSDIKSFCIPIQNGTEACAKLIDEYKPDHIIAVERPGKAFDGKYYNMRADDVSHITAETDLFISEAKTKGIVTIAIGDGGNEVGLGKLRNEIIKYVTNGEKIYAKEAADYVLVAGVSNWGCYGIIAGLSMLDNELYLPDILEEKLLLKGVVEAGAVDGCTKKSEMTVDGLSLEENMRILVQLNELVNSYIAEKSYA